MPTHVANVWLAVLAMLVAHNNFGATPQLATVRDFARPHVRVVRTNVVGRYATVTLRGAIMEGAPLADAILLEHFSFGWQPLEAVNDPCVLARQVTSRRDRIRLMRGMPEHHTVGLCEYRPVRDSGSRRDVDAVRSRMVESPLVPSVIVFDRFALANWSGGGGGQTLWQRDGAGWRLALGVGGALGVAEMRRFGVPRAAWCAFVIVDAPCPKDGR